MSELCLWQDKANKQ